MYLVWDVRRKFHYTAVLFNLLVLSARKRILPVYLHSQYILRQFHPD